MEGGDEEWTGAGAGAGVGGVVREGLGASGVRGRWYLVGGGRS